MARVGSGCTRLRTCRQACCFRRRLSRKMGRALRASLSVDEEVSRKRRVQASPRRQVFGCRHELGIAACWRAYRPPLIGHLPTLLMDLVGISLGMGNAEPGAEAFTWRANIQHKANGGLANAIAVARSAHHARPPRPVSLLPCSRPHPYPSTPSPRSYTPSASTLLGVHMACHAPFVRPFHRWV